MAYWQYIHVKQLYIKILKEGYKVTECIKVEEDMFITLRHPDKSTEEYISIVLTADKSVKEYTYLSY